MRKNTNNIFFVVKLLRGAKPQKQLRFIKSVLMIHKKINNYLFLLFLFSAGQYRSTKEGPPPLISIAPFSWTNKQPKQCTVLEFVGQHSKKCLIKGTTVHPYKLRENTICILSTVLSQFCEEVKCTLVLHFGR